MNPKPNRKGAGRWTKAALAALLTAALVPSLPAYASTDSDKVNDVLSILSTEHVSGTSEEALSEAAIRGMVAKLNDPYTQYMSKDEWEQFKNQLARQFVGIGVSMGQDEKGMYVVQVFEGSPAEAAGIQPGEYLVEAAGKSLAGLSTQDAAALIQGKENTEVTLKVKNVKGETRTIQVKRQTIKLPVLESKLLPGGVGYIKLYSFSDDADELFEAALAKLKADPSYRTLVLDLRDNPGGLLQSAANIAAKFIAKGPMIHTKDRSGKDYPVVIESGEVQKEPVYVMVNENSASCSEVLAGALQDYHAATVVGTKSFGKGSVQQVYTFTDGSSLKVTVVEYLTPNGHKVNGVGIQPDVQLDGGLNQLLTVLRKAGIQSFNVDQTPRSVTVNGMKVSDGVPMFEENGKLWIHSRILADLAGAETVWHPEDTSVEIKPEGAAEGARFSEAAGTATYKQGLMFLDAEAFEAAFPGVDVSGNADHLTLTAGQGGN